MLVFSILNSKEWRSRVIACGDAGIEQNELNMKLKTNVHASGSPNQTPGAKEMAHYSGQRAQGVLGRKFYSRHSSQNEFKYVVSIGKILSQRPDSNLETQGNSSEAREMDEPSREQIFRGV